VRGKRAIGAPTSSVRFPGLVFVLGVALALLAVMVPSSRLLAQQGQNEEPRNYIVRLREDTVIDHLRGQSPGPPRRMQLMGGEAGRYRLSLRGVQAGVRQQIETFTGAAVREQMDTVFNGFAVRLRPQDVASVQALPGVAEVIPSVEYHKVLDAALPLADVPAAWSNLSVGGEANAGRGVKIGVIDTGIDINHPMLQDSSLSPPAGYPLFTLATSSCPNSDQRFTNSKVIVARNYVPLLANLDLNCDAMDRDGHGTFVSAIVAGRRAQAPLASIAGVAPEAFLGSYKVFGTPGINDGASLGAILKALDDAAKDGMDIINMSLGAATTTTPSQDPLASAVTAAVNAGLTVVVAVGNGGPATGTITSPGTAPAAITVAATTNSRVLANPLQLSGPVPVPPSLQLIAAVIGDGPAITADLGPLPMTDIITIDSSESACAALPGGSLNRQMALIRRGGCSFETKILNAYAAGAAAVVIYNNQFQQPPISMAVGSAIQIPSVMIGNTDGLAVAAYLAAAGTGAQGKIAAQQQAIATTPNQVTGFSSAGPSTDFGIKPDLAAPGSNIYSAEQMNFTAGGQYSASGFGQASGTSFSSPMVAGAAALVKQVFPAFTPDQIKSVLVQSAAKVVTPFAGGVSGVLAYGNGLLDVGAALAAPATVSPSSISFGANTPGSVLAKTFNLTVTNVTAGSDTFTLTQAAGPASGIVSLSATPASFTLGSGVSQSVSIQASSPQPVTGAVEGTLVLHSQNTGKDLTIPFWGTFLVPNVNNNGTLNAASFSSGPVFVAAGSLVSIFGTQLTAGATASATSIPLPTSLAGTQVIIQGIPAPLLYASPTQINAQIPQEVAGRTLAIMQIFLNGVASAAAPVSLAPTGPGIFAVNQAGTGQGAILHSSTQGAVTSSDPAKPGEILEVYANGLGSATPAVATGQAASSNPVSSADLQPTAFIGGVSAPVRFAGLAPGFVALYQVNVEVPAGAPVGGDQLILISNGVASNPVTVSIGR
jgi:minor extracellular serine protease Vpr